MRDNTYGLSVSEKIEYYSMPEPMSGCTLWVGSLAIDGYGQIGIRGRNKKAHRVAWEEKNGPIPPGLFVLHKCDNRACVNVNHLLIGTQLDNIKDRDSKNRGIVGENHKLSKITEKDVFEIREILSGDGLSLREIGERYGISSQKVWQIKNRISWKHVH